MLKAYKGLSPKTRLGVGVGIIAWSIAGLYISDRAEEKFGFTPSEDDKAELRKYAPQIIAVDRPEGR